MRGRLKNLVIDRWFLRLRFLVSRFEEKNQENCMLEGKIAVICDTIAISAYLVRLYKILVM